MTLFRGQVDLEKLNRKLRDNYDYSVHIYMDSHVFMARVDNAATNESTVLSTTGLMAWINSDGDIALDRWKKVADATKVD